MKGIKLGICHSIHLYNAMTPFHHRECGTVGAIFDIDITTETICDGIHITYPALRTACKIKTVERLFIQNKTM